MYPAVIASDAAEAHQGSIERILDRMSEIAISEAKHGPAGQRRHTSEPTYILR